MGGRRDLQATMLAFVDLEERVPTDSSSAVAVSSGGGGGRGRATRQCSRRSSSGQDCMRAAWADGYQQFNAAFRGRLTPP